MKVVYSNQKVEKQCTVYKETLKLFGGNKKLADCLKTRIKYLEEAATLKDMVLNPKLRFHSLHNKGKRKYEGFSSIDIKTRKDPWRRPL